MRNYLITICNWVGVEIYAQQYQAKNENEAIIQALTGVNALIIRDGDTIKIEEV